MRLLADFSEVEFMEVRYKCFPGVVYSKDIFMKAVSRCVEAVFRDRDISGEAKVTEAYNGLRVEFQQRIIGFERNEDGICFDVSIPDWVQVQWLIHYAVKLGRNK